jgi:CO/xanthine dehydrogenase Mo-binding subunit
MADYKLIGKNYTTPDLVAKVTGRAKYAEDYRAEGMLFCKLLLSPRPHARVTRIDASAALAMPGVHAVLTADDMPAPPPPPAPPAAPPAPAAQGGARMSSRASPKPTWSSSTRSTSSPPRHQPLETRTAMAYWQNGKLYLHGSTQSVSRTVAAVAGWVGVPQSDVVVISEYCGGGFGSKIPGAQSMAIPALLSKKLNGRPVMMRISREEETYIGRTRPGFQAWAKMGFKKDGTVTAVRRLHHRRQRTVSASG